MIKAITWLLSLFFVLIIPIKSFPMTIMDASTSELTSESVLIVQGNVVSKLYQWENDQQKAINTIVTIHVTQYLKGEGQKEINIKQLGGKIGDLQDIIDGTPNLNPGEEVILFLLVHNGDYVIHSMALGCYKVVQDKNHQTIAVNDLRNVNLINPDSQLKQPSENKIKSFPLDKLVSDIKFNLNK